MKVTICDTTYEELGSTHVYIAFMKTSSIDIHVVSARNKKEAAILLGAEPIWIESLYNILSSAVGIMQSDTPFAYNNTDVQFMI